MRTVMMISSLLGIAACGISEEEWAEEYQVLWCDQIEKCGSPLECDDGAALQQSGEFCEYDRAAAKACLDEEAWGCDENDFPTIPGACEDVVICSGTTGDETPA